MKIQRIIYLYLGVISLMSFVAFPKPAMAEAKYSIKEMTPEVSAALENRRNRYDALRALKQKGAIGENNKGYVELLTADDSEAASVVDAENADRKVIYTTIAQQNNLENDLATIEGVFAQVQSDKAETGDKVQTPEGAWGTK